MRFDVAKKEAIKNYLLEKIEDGTEGISDKVATNFNINQNTVHTYINELIKEGIIERKKRGSYKLIEKTTKFVFSRKKGEISDETKTFLNYIQPLIDGYGKNVQEIWQYAFEEMFNNVIDHSLAQKCIVIVGRDAKKTSIWIADDGVGIFENIKRFFKLSSAKDALTELFKGKVTTNSEEHSGEGIFFTSRMMDEFVIFSEDISFCIDKYDESIILKNPLKGKTGTAIYMSLDNNSEKNSIDIFNKYSDVDGGFNKTSIKLKNIYGKSPTSRSQAKRLCVGFDRFDEVELDFEGIEWMGQGFAHQVFKVFAGNHPDVKITTKGMDENVIKMYKHVMNTK